MSARVRVKLGARSYDIRVGPGLLAGAGELAASVLPPPRLAVIITNPKINRLYGRKVTRDFISAGFKVAVVEVPAGERSKSLARVDRICGRLLELGANRQSAVVALGGGVVGDLAGFVAATYMRGIGLIQIPTTLLAQVDSSVGGKTGVDHVLAKNIIGAFYQPRLVIIDPLVLETLPAREMRAGAGEVIKYAFIAGEPLLGRVRAVLPVKPDSADLAGIIADCCRFKAQVVGEDERDQGRRAILNYGHTIGHAIEAVAGYRRYNHGEAVAVGMIGAAEIARAKVMLNESEVALHREMIGAAGLPQKMASMWTRDVYDHLRRDKKRVDAGDRLVLLKGLGRPVVETVAADLIKKTVKALGGGAK